MVWMFEEINHSKKLSEKQKMSGVTLRKRARVCYYEPEEPPFDEFIYCTDCRDYVYEYCAIHGPLLVIPDDKVPAVTGLPAFVPRAALTVPRVFLHLAYSYIPGAGIGVFSTLTLPSGVRFGPYRGRRLKTAVDSGYEWQLYDRNNKPSYVVDASDANNSNWMRYVNCARRYSEQNLVAFQYQGELYYRTVKIVPRFTELLVFYGSEFANRLGVDLRRYSKPCDCEHCQPKFRVNNEPEKTNKAKSPKEKKDETEIKDAESGQASFIAEKTAVETNKRKTSNEKKEETDIKHVSFDQAKLVTKKPAKTNKRKSPNEKKNKTLIKNGLTKGTEKLQEPSSSQAALLMNINVQEMLIKPAIDISDKIVSNATNVYKCDQCNKIFDIKSDLEQHLQSHIVLKISGRNPGLEKGGRISSLKCKKCSCTFDTRLLALEHAKSRHGVQYFTCSDCEYATSEKGSLQMHLRVHTGERPFKCDQCNAAFAQRSALQYHKSKHTGDRPFKCDQCNAAFAQSSDLQKHKRIHTGDKPFKCDQCNAAFARSDCLKTHKRIHTGDKPFKCDQCNAAFAQSNSLQYHKSKHTGDRPFKCDQCNAAFALSSSLQRHKRIHTGDKPYKCDQCNAAFAQSSALQGHKRIHTGDKPYKCDQCNAAFALSSDLQRHKRIHTGDKPFECNICDYRATRSSYLKDHLMVRHSGLKPFGCDLCSYRGAIRQHLRQHMKTHQKSS